MSDQDWSYRHNLPREQVHGGTPPPRQGGRGLGASAKTVQDNALLLVKVAGAIATIAGAIYLLTKD